MFLGHFGLALAAKKVAPKTSFGTALLATEFADCLWPAFLLLGWERVAIVPGITRMTPLDFISYPWSHSLLMDLIWAAGFAAVYFVARRYQAGTWVVFAGVLSHWVLDWWSHRQDMPLTPWTPQKYGLGLWNSAAGTVVVELLLFLAGLAIYLRETRARDRTGNVALWSFVVLMAAIWAGAVFGPPPPSVNAIKFSGVALWLAVAWAYWIDRHRASEATPSIASRHTRLVGFVVLALALAWLVYELRSQHMQAQRDALYRGVLSHYQNDLHAGMSRREVTGYLDSSHIPCTDAGIRRSGNTWSYLVRIGTDPSGRLDCKQWEVYIALDFDDPSKNPGDLKGAPPGDPSDIL